MLGSHYLIDFWGCNDLSADEWDQLLRKVVETAEAQLIELRVETFEPQGLTAFCMLAESHLSVHTWPEKEYIGIDFFTCGRSTKLEQAVEELASALLPKRQKITRVRRGVPADAQLVTSPTELSTPKE